MSYSNWRKKAEMSDFLCDFRFENNMPDPSAKYMLLPLKRDIDDYCKYKFTSLEKNWKPELYVEPDMGIPLDLLDMSVFNPPKGEKIPLDPEDEELLRDDDPITQTMTDGIKRKERPTDEDFSWLVKTQYTSPLTMGSTKQYFDKKELQQTLLKAPAADFHVTLQSVTEKQAKRLRESHDQNCLAYSDDRERNIQVIIASFEACKSQPVHAVNRQLKPKRVLPLFPCFDWHDDQFVVVKFSTAPNADSGINKKIIETHCVQHEHGAITESYISSSSNAEKPDKFSAFTEPPADEDVAVRNARIICSRIGSSSMGGSLT